MENDILKEDLLNYLQEKRDEHHSYSSFIDEIISYSSHADPGYGDINDYPLDDTYYICKCSFTRMQTNSLGQQFTEKYSKTCIVNGDGFNKWRKKQYEIIWL